MKTNATAFRNNLYQLLDKVLNEGEILEIERNGKTIVIMEKKRKDIYQIMDERAAQVSESETNYEPEIINGLDKDWEESWNNQWNEWLSEK